MKNRLVKKADNDHNDIRVFYQGQIADNGNRGVTDKVHGVIAMIENEQVGYLEFCQYQNKPEAIEQYGVDGCLDITKIDVNSKFPDSDIKSLLYKKFDEIYNASFKNWPVMNYDNFNKELNNQVQASIIDRRIKKADSEKVDLRNLVIEDAGVIKSEEEKAGHKDMHLVNAYISGQKVGYMEFSVWHDDEYLDRNEIFIENLNVDEKYRKQGIATAIYIKFDEIYNSQFSGWKLVRTFTSPVAEYTFRKCVELGYVSANMLQEANLNRDYYTDEKAKEWKDLRKKLPEHLQGEDDVKATVSDFRRRIFASIVDLRDIEVTYEGEVDDMSTVKYKEISHEIYAQRDGEELGHLVFSQVENYPGSLIGSMYKDITFEKALYIEDLVVYPKYKNYGIDLEMYKIFGKIYNEKFASWPVARYYIDPESEAAFRKAIGLGFISETALDENYIKRDKTNYEKSQNIVQDLRGQLPDHVKGPEVWARLDMRVKVARVDFRR